MDSITGPNQAFGFIEYPNLFYTNQSFPTFTLSLIVNLNLWWLFFDM